jgi:hypothetical protein
MKKLILSLSVILFFISFVSGQKTKYVDDHDTSYYKTYRSMVTARGYLSRKYTVLGFTPPEPVESFKYRASTSLNVGIGATYHAVTVNIGVGINRFNPGNEKGHTKYLDLQGHFYARKWNIDVLGEFYKGYYLSGGLAAPPGQQYYVRPDIGLSLVGIAFYRALNEKKFSYQAGLLQNEWQRKSAGSILVGAEIYYGSIHGDSTLAPTAVDSKTSLLDINKFHYFSLGPGLGYAYTLVFKEHYFLLASGTINLAIRYSAEISSTFNDKEERFSFRPNYLLHAGGGYNGNKWSLSLLWVDTELFMKGKETAYSYTVSVGNYRLIYARRFNIGRKTKEILAPIPAIIGQ